VGGIATREPREPGLEWNGADGRARGLRQYFSGCDPIFGALENPSVSEAQVLEPVDDLYKLYEISNQF
jgi:hypothetical protein